MKQKTVGMTLRAVIIALALIMVAGSPALPPFDGVAYAQTGLSAVFVPDGSNVQVSWGAISGADSYEVWKGDGRGSSVIWPLSALASVTAPTVSYTDEEVTAGATYSYAIRPVDDGTAGTWSNVVNVTIPGGTTAPTGAPTVTVAADGLTAVDVSWTSVSGATQYHIQFWHAALGNNWERISGDQTSPYNHSSRTPGTEYFYVVRAVNAGGNGEWSNWRTDNSKITLQATTTTPTLTLTRVDRTTVQLSWTSTGGGAQYDLQRRKTYVDFDSANVPPDDDDTVGWARLPSSLLATSTHTDSAANYVPTDAQSVTYEYRVRAEDSNGVAGDWSKVKSVSIPEAGAVLSAPTGFRASPTSDSNIRLTWDNIDSDGAEFYELQWKSGDRSYSTPIRVNRPDSGNSFYDHTSLSPATRYTYQVRGVDINGAGDWSSAIGASTRSTAAAAGQMPKVRGLTVTDATSDDDEPLRTAKLTWTAVSDATHYEIQRFDPGAGAAADWAPLTDNGLLLDDVGRISVANAKSPPTYDDANAMGANGKTFFYVVSAIDDRSGVMPADQGLVDDKGEWSDYKSVTFKDFKPAGVTETTAVKTSGNSILVSWTAPVVVADADGAATSYRLEWRTSATTTFVGSVAVTGTSYHHTGLRGNTSYHYRVRAENSGGESDYVAFEDPVVLGNTLTPPTGVKAEDATTGMGEATTYGIKVSWNAVTGADGYEIQRFGTGDANNEWGDLAGGGAGTASPAPGTSETNDELSSGTTSLAESTTYLYRVRTVKEDAKSGWSATASGTTKAMTPPATTLYATSTGVSMIRLSWGAVTGATTYELEFLEGMYEAVDFADPNIGKSKITISGNFRNYVHTGRKAGTRYTYRLRAALPQSTNTDWSEIELQYTKPARADLSASTTVPTSMALKWDAVSFVAENGTAGRLGVGTDADDSYEIERRESGSGDWASVVVATDACVVDTNKCMVTDTELTAGTDYFYRIRATVVRDGTTYNSYWDNTTQRTPAN